MLLKLLNIDSLRKIFKPEIYERGQAYFRQDRVRHLEQHHDKKTGDIISAEVRGTQVYQVKIRILRGMTNKLLIRSICTCPMTVNCKHIVATLLEAIKSISVAAKEPKI